MNAHESILDTEQGSPDRDKLLALQGIPPDTDQSLLAELRRFCIQSRILHADYEKTRQEIMTAIHGMSQDMVKSRDLTPVFYDLESARDDVDELTEKVALLEKKLARARANAQRAKRKKTKARRKKKKSRSR